MKILLFAHERFLVMLLTHPDQKSGLDWLINTVSELLFELIVGAHLGISYFNTAFETFGTQYGCSCRHAVFVLAGIQSHWWHRTKIYLHTGYTQCY